MSEESKHEKFLRMREARVPKAVHAIGLLSNLSSHHYECDEDEAAALVGDLQTAVDEVAAAFGVRVAASAAADETAVAAGEAPAEEDAPAAPAASPRQEVPPHLKPFPEDLTREEDLHIFRIARELDRAINAIQDGKGRDAIQILLGLTTA